MTSSSWEARTAWMAVWAGAPSISRRAAPPKLFNRGSDMRVSGGIRAVVAAVAVVLCASHGWAQQPPSAGPPGPPKGLSGSAGFGLSLTQGNSDTLNLSATVDSIYDPKTRNVMKWNLLYLRGKQNDVLSVNRVSAMFRDENALSERAFVYGEVDYLHDTFKG